jgi:hypothetical protein
MADSVICWAGCGSETVDIGGGDWKWDLKECGKTERTVKIQYGVNQWWGLEGSLLSLTVGALDLFFLRVPLPVFEMRPGRQAT